MKTIKLADWCEKTGVKYLTAWRWFKTDKMPVRAYQTDSGTILVEDDDQPIVDSKIEDSDTNKALSLFLKKTIEYTSNNSSVEDFAAFVISNFQLKLLGQEQPKYSRNKPKSEEVQKHFKNFIPTTKKPEPFVFIPEPEVWENISDNSIGINEETTVANAEKVAHELVNAPISITDNLTISVNEVKDLQNQVSGNVSFGSSGTFGSSISNPNSDAFLSGIGVSLTYPDINTQNYTYSTNATNRLLGSSLEENSVFMNLYNALHKPGPGLIEKPKRGRPRKKNND